MCVALLNDVRRNIVEEIRGATEVNTVPAAVSCPRPCSCSPGVFPHSPGVSPGAGIIEDQHAHGYALANQGGGEPTERPLNEKHMPGADGFDGEVGVSGEAGVPVVAG